MKVKILGVFFFSHLCLDLRLQPFELAMKFNHDHL